MSAAPAIKAQQATVSGASSRADNGQVRVTKILVHPIKVSTIIVVVSYSYDRYLFLPRAVVELAFLKCDILRRVLR